MKRLKKIFINLVVVVMLVAACFSFAGCKDVREMELTVSVYNNETDKVEEVTLTVELYGHLAKQTVDAIEGYINDGYYNDAIFYMFSDSTYSKQLMLGDLKYVDGEIVQNTIKPELEKAEFTRGGTKGSNLVSEKGTIGLWRSWYESDAEYRTNSNALTSGRATWYMPTSTISSYEDWFCVFAKIDFEEEGNEDAFNTIIDGCNTSLADYTEYVIYYTGEYDETKADENHGLTFHCVEKEDYDEDEIDELFTAEGEQYVCYNATTIKVPVVLTTNEPAVKIISAKMV